MAITGFHITSLWPLMAHKWPPFLWAINRHYLSFEEFFFRILIASATKKKLAMNLLVRAMIDQSIIRTI